MMIKYFRDSAKEPLDDPLTMISYEREKRQLDKRLAKQKKSVNRLTSEVMKDN